MAFSPTITVPSQVVPGVKFTVHRMGFARRVDLDMKALKLRQRLRELEVDNPPDSPLEKELHEAIAIARRKAMAVPPEEVEAVIAADLLPLLDQLSEAQGARDPEIRKQRAVLHEEYQQVETQMRVMWVRDGLVSIEGGDVDGMTADELLNYGPPNLAAEIYQALASDGKLSGSESKNSSSLTTSGAPVGGDKTASTAPNAGPLPGATT